MQGLSANNAIKWYIGHKYLDNQEELAIRACVRMVKLEQDHKEWMIKNKGYYINKRGDIVSS